MKKVVTPEQRDRILFCAGFAKVAEAAAGANISGAEAEAFVDAAVLRYRLTGLPGPSVDWIDTGAPNASISWFVDSIVPLFQSVSHRPRWLGEPWWLYLADSPMVFVGQLSDESALAPSGKREIFIFRGNLPGDREGHHRTYRICFQETDANGYVSTGTP